MRRLIEHLIDQNWNEIVSKSLLHCHAKNMHSLMLLDAPEKRIRMFVADTGNPLSQNYPATVSAGAELSIAFHPHHCNLTLAPVLGAITNWLVWKLPADACFEMTRFTYRSAIGTDEPARFIRQEKNLLHTRRVDLLPTGSHCYMSAGDIHTVAVPDDRVTAWLVFEGLEDKDYHPDCWSNAPLATADFSDLYKKPSEAEVVELFKIAGFGDLL